MNKTQLILLWIGAALFIFCLWNPKIAPHTRDILEDREYTDKDWERELSNYGLSLTDSKETLRDKNPNKHMPPGWERSDEISVQKIKYIKMLLKGERPTKYVKVGWDIYYRRFFKTEATYLVARLLSVAVITALAVYTLGDKNRVKVKEILQPLIRFKSKPDKKPKADQKQ